MNPVFTKALRKLYYQLFSDYVLYQGVPLPDKRLRTGGCEFKDDAYFYQSAQTEAQRIISHFGYSEGQKLLDIGCGFGRLAIGFLIQPKHVSYLGLDVNKFAVDWCQRHIEKQHEGFYFMHLNVRNERYYAEGQAIDSNFRFPIADQEFDIAYLYSVFSHMVSEDIGVYLRDLQRILKPEGHLFFTAFVEDDVPDMTINPVGYRDIEWHSSLHCVRYNRKYMQNLLTQSGFRLDDFVYEQETNGQSAFYTSVVA